MKSKCSFRTFSIWLVVAWLVIFAVIPQLLVVVASFLTTSKQGFFTLPLTLEQYRQLVDPVILGIAGRSLALAGMVTLVCLVLGYPFAWILARTPRNYRTFLLILLVIPFWTNSLIRTYALIAILNTRGLLNTLLLATGIIETPLRILYTQGAVLVGLTYTLLPFMVLPLYAAIEKLDPGLKEAARDLGASRWATFVRVDLPLTQGGIIAGCMLVFLPALGMFYIPDILGGARSLLMGNFIRDQFMTARNWPFGSAASVFLTVIMTLLLGVYAWRRAATTRQGEGT